MPFRSALNRHNNYHSGAKLKPMDDPAAESTTNLIVIFQTGAIDPNEDPEVAAELLESRTSLGGETPYAMKFVNETHSSLTVFDAISMPGDAYPLPENALDSLPPLARALLQQNGSIQFQGAYDPDERAFSTVELDWTKEDAVDRLASLLDGGLSVHEAVDWLVVEEQERFASDQWADIRDVTESAVQSNVEAAREQIAAEDS